MGSFSAPAIDRVTAALYRVPTDRPESDGTLEWNHTDVVVITAEAAGATGLGWSCASGAAALFAKDILADAAVDRSAMDVEGVWHEMTRRLRNAGRPAAGSMAIAAVDTALWDLKAKLIGKSLADLFGTVRQSVEIYGSGGFTSYSAKELEEQLAGWLGNGIRRVKMKVGRDSALDPARVRLARKVIGNEAELFVDANGAYRRKQALALAQQFAGESGVSWFEEPLSSDNLAGLNWLRERGPAGMDIAAGEYGDTLDYFRRMITAEAVDCLQADVTRCGGYSGFLKVAAMCEAWHIPLSAHCAPQLHAPLGCAVQPLRHIEYFHDHARLEPLLFDGILAPENGALTPDRGKPGHGATLKVPDAEAYRI